MAAAALYVGAIRPAAAIDSIAVLPFENDSGSPDMEYLGDGITESLINALSLVPNLAVTPRSSVFRYKGAQPTCRRPGNRFACGRCSPDG